MRVVTNFTHNKASEQIEELGKKVNAKGYPASNDVYVLGYLQACMMVQQLIEKWKDNGEDALRDFIDDFTEVIPPEVQFFTKEIEDASTKEQGKTVGESIRPLAESGKE